MTRKKADDYFDAAQLWEGMQERGGGRYRVRNYGTAVSLRQRCYKWRLRQQELTAQRLGETPGIPPSTPYDGYKISLRDSNDQPVITGKPSGEHTHFDLLFYVEDLSGEFVE